jgi:hypothetical protein
MKTYIASRSDGHPVIRVLDDRKRGSRRLLPARSLRIHNHSPYGFEWGYGGSGPAQLALAILLDLTGEVGIATARYQPFKWAFIAPAPEEGFTLTEAQIRVWLDEHQPGTGFA